LERQGKPSIEFLSLRELEAAFFQHELRVLQTHVLTNEIKTELQRAGRASSALNFESSLDYVLVRATKVLS
jgi:hypothetical protein